MRKRDVNLKTTFFRHKTILSGANGNVIISKGSEGPLWLELVRIPTGTCLERQNQNIKALHQTWHQTLAPNIYAFCRRDDKHES
jgi:hypothetical protein